MSGDMGPVERMLAVDPSIRNDHQAMIDEIVRLREERDALQAELKELVSQRDEAEELLAAATAAVRALCERYGDTFWDGELSVPDMITYHLEPGLERLVEKAGKAEKG